LAPDVGGVNYPGYFKVFAEHDVRVTLKERLTAVRRPAPQEVRRNRGGRYQLFRIGDAVASRNIHAAVYDAFRLCLAL
jgi:hypothetical protein